MIVKAAAVTSRIRFRNGITLPRLRCEQPRFGLLLERYAVELRADYLRLEWNREATSL